MLTVEILKENRLNFREAPQMSKQKIKSAYLDLVALITQKVSIVLSLSGSDFH